MEGVTGQCGPEISTASSLLGFSLSSQLSSGLAARLWPGSPLPNHTKVTAAQPPFGMERLVPGPESIVRGAKQENLCHP